MSPEVNKSAGPITDFLVKDHGRLEGLLESAVARVGSVNQGTYDQFRAGLLRHIGMEEKILLPAAQRLRGGEPLPIASKLRLDHGAIASLLMPPLHGRGHCKDSCRAQGSQYNRRRPRWACMKPATSWQAQKRRSFWPSSRLHRNWLCCPAPIVPP